MTSKSVQTIVCPKCQQTLQMTAIQCQFCGSVLGKDVPRPAQAFYYQHSKRKSWEEIAYTLLAIYWIFVGVYGVLQGFNIVPNALYEIGGGGFVGIIGGLNIFLGVGLLMEQTWAQAIIKIFCWLQLVQLILGFLFIFVSSNPLLFFLTQGFQTALVGLQLHVINVIGDV